MHACEEEANTDKTRKNYATTKIMQEFAHKVLNECKKEGKKEKEKEIYEALISRYIVNI